MVSHQLNEVQFHGIDRKRKQKVQGMRKEISPFYFSNLYERKGEILYLKGEFPEIFEGLLFLSLRI
jgi:hypothetical protein